MRPPSCPLMVIAALVAWAGLWTEAGAGQTVGVGERSAEEVLEGSRAAQRRFERDRVRWLPINRSWAGGSCGEVLGRMCFDHAPRGDFYPVPEDPRIVAAREELLATLAEAAAELPLDPWLVGQRVAYLGEAGRWDMAATLAGECAGREVTAGGGEGGRGADLEQLRGRAWCRALEGLALHALGRYPEAENAFRRGLAGMDAAAVAMWSDPEPLLDPSGRDWWTGLDRNGRQLRAPSVWALADPLLIVPGNDLLTEHWARWTMARVRAEASNPYGMRWGSDLEQLLVRYGWEVGWERAESRSLGLALSRSVVGQHHPESRPLIPPGAALADPAAVSEVGWIPDARRPRAAYAPAYAPVLLPGAGQIAVFPRGDRIAVVGAYAMPEDTTRHADHAHPGRDVVHPYWQNRGTRAGLFLMPADDPAGEVHAATTEGQHRGGLVLQAPAGRWVASLEVFAPAARRAGRTRTGIDRAPVPPDVATLSDLLLMEGALPADASLEQAAARALPRRWLRTGERIGVAWEVFGLGYRLETLSYRLTVLGANGGVLRRVARWLGLVGPDRAQRLEWEEQAPDRPGPALRSVELQLPSLVPGRYRLRLEVQAGGRTPLVREALVELRP